MTFRKTNPEQNNQPSKDNVQPNQEKKEQIERLSQLKGNSLFSPCRAEAKLSNTHHFDDDNHGPGPVF
ncbi:hypothetical protein [Legionella waltersii]|uniref:Uncharacterized protein n=1 Tax=Legionella waltersii TaxID=66969 RepID=A0A0W1ANS0_9GAMM|nr:hypothetical protein [Legionella waltersii]KTD82954.1 hypothetical protein Lwal_0173 [Legionella waltersii]SNU97347.1 Uncharacterised protein [Legionella waltersii]